MTRFGVLIFALVLVFSSAEGWAADKNGGYTAHGNLSCGYYLDAYSKTTLKGDGYLEGPHEAWGVFGWIIGYLAAYNEHIANGKEDILGGMTGNDAMRWVAAWCQDNPSRTVWEAAYALTRKLDR